MAADGCLEGLELAARLGVLDAVLPELTALKGVEQSHFHHLDVYEHTLAVLRELIALELDPDVEEVLAQPLADELTRGEALRFGALFHDVGKPATRGERPDGRVTFIGHDAVGEEMVGDVFRRLRTSEKLRSFVGKITREHLVLGFLVHDRPLSGAPCTPTCAGASRSRWRSPCSRAPTGWPPAGRARSRGSRRTWSWRGR